MKIGLLRAGVIVVGLRLRRRAVEIRFGHGVCRAALRSIHGARGCGVMPYIHGMNTLVVPKLTPCASASS